ncbi:protein IN CHLOROPLAST ATPASE BIOGENESIS, chloroplastic-like isoform X2 [Euphorbia lathyris]
MEMPLVEVHKHGVWLLAKTVDQFIHKILVEEDAKMTSKCKEEQFCDAADAGENLYTMGDFAESKISNVDVYLIKRAKSNAAFWKKRPRKLLQNSIIA